MEKLSLLIVFILLSFSLFGACLLTNGNMESWNDNGSGGPPDSWSLSSGNLTGSQESTTVHGGSYSTNLTWTTTSTVRMEQSVNVSEGTDYEFCFYAYDNDPDGRVRVCIRWFDSSGSLISGYYGDYSTDTAGWQWLRTGAQTAPTGAVSATAEIRCYDVSGWDGDATVYVDDATFCENSCLPVTLSSFYATYKNDELSVHWKTQSEDNNLAWNIYRAEEQNFEDSYKINQTDIPGYGTTTDMHEYNFVDNTPVQHGKTYYYWIESLDYSGNSELYDPISITVNQEEEPNVPNVNQAEVISQNYPNPFNPFTKIDYNVEVGQTFTIVIYNIKGEKIKTLYNGVSKGSGSIVWNGTDDSGKSVPTGIYMYKLIMNNKTVQKKMILLK